jgi:5-methylcytosine-specific restriction endonuclease McrA
MKTKVCYKCKHRKYLKYFSPSSGPLNTHSYCKKCYRIFKRESYIRNREKEIIRCSIWNKKNSKKVALNMAKCRKRKPKHFKEYSKMWRRKNKDKVKIYDHKKRINRHFQKLKTKYPINEMQWKLKKKKQNNKCFYCNKKKDLTMDHKIALCIGGSHSTRNIVGACKSCNSRKWKRTAKQFLKRIKNERN